jgi:hypothetical protein
MGKALVIALVVYVGDDSRLLGPLENALGPQFAGL